MPTITPRRQKTIVQSDVLEEPVDLSNKPRSKSVVKKDVPVGKIVSSTLETRISSTLAKSTSMAMLNTVGKNAAITGNEAYNLYHPALRMLSRRLPDVALKTNLSKPDADDLELIIVTVIEYLARIVDNWTTLMYLRFTGKIPQNTMPQPTQPEMPKSETPKAYVPIETELEEFMPETGESPDIAPMKNGNGTLADLIDRGFIPRDLGENIA